MEEWFSAKIIKWYHQNKRDLPWRNTNDPYKIWLSEIILQQTQVVQGLAYYNRFVLKYPVVNKLAAANEDEVLKLWQGLGYYSRARNLLTAARQIKEHHGGKFPANYAHIKELKGVGDYTAAAIASFAFDLPHAVVDGNVYRLLSRVFGIETPIDSGLGKKQFFELANELLPVKKAAIHNQAIMEFGSQYCKPTSPNCTNCIFNTRCYAFKNNSVTSLPVKSKKTKVKKRYFNYLILTDLKGNLLLNRREQNDIWKGLYEFVLIETNQPIKADKLRQEPTFKNICGTNFDLIHVSKEYKHILSHQHLMAVFYIIKMNKLIAKRPYIKTNTNKMNAFAYPRLVEKFMNDCNLKEMI